MIITEYNSNGIITEAVNTDEGKKLFLSGIFMESEQKNRNGRTYAKGEIEAAVRKINEAAQQGRHILGELDHPDGSLEVKLQNVSHKITEMRMDGNNAVGKAEIITTVPQGKVAQGLMEAGIQLGVSSRGSGSVSESTGMVEGFNLVTVDIVANPSAINAYPESIAESLQLRRNGELLNVAEAAIYDSAAQKYFEKEIIKLIRSFA